jgi:hypothetical protein
MACYSAAEFYFWMVGKASVAVNSDQEKASLNNSAMIEALGRRWAGAYRAGRAHKPRVNQREISGKAISSVMMITSHPRNQKQPLKIVSNGI